MKINPKSLDLKNILMQNTVEELKEFCRGNNLSPSGNKNDIIDRILENEDNFYDLKEILRSSLFTAGDLKNILEEVYQTDREEYGGFKQNKTKLSELIIEKDRASSTGVFTKIIGLFGKNTQKSEDRKNENDRQGNDLKVIFAPLLYIYHYPCNWLLTAISGI